VTLNEALADIERRVSDGSDEVVCKENIPCGDTQHAVRIVAEAFEHLRRRDPLYGDRRRVRSVVPPPSSLPPG